MLPYFQTVSVKDSNQREENGEKKTPDETAPEAKSVHDVWRRL